MYTQDPMRRFNRLMAWVSASLLLMVTVLRPAAKINVHTLGTLPPLAAPLLVAAFAVWSQVVGCPRLRDAFVLFFWAVLITVCIGSLVFIAARAPAPLADWQLARIDQAIGLQTSDIMRGVCLHPQLAAVLAAIYSWMIPFSLLALVLPVFQGLREPPQRLLIGYTVAALVTIAVFAVCPAVGPWTVYHFAASHAQAVCQTTLGLLKSSGPLREDIVDCGLVAFPSFHVAQTVLTALSLWHSRWLRFPATALAILICVSTLTTGWHYVIDLVGGVAVAIIAYAFAAWVFRRFVRQPDTNILMYAHDTSGGAKHEL
jgi:membrane-associated phospholipid phosphatase